ncbi:PseG/SpsG family protein [Halosimplex sp. TS25]|uniref:PseG/SpsG family protein n=1 Tax=Halosimplex rarum TaxID=3396619 RepID=UPI0039EBA3AB
MEVTVRADGGPEIGYGHLVRTGALAAELVARGHAVTFATATATAAREICPGIAVLELPDRHRPGPFVDWVATHEPDVVFTDAYPVGTAYQRAVRDHAPLVVWQDDARHAVCADAFINGNLYAQDLAYKFRGAEPRTYLGMDYVLLREAIRERAARQPPWRARAERALVSMGGSDVAEVTPDVVRAFDGLSIEVDVVVGPGFSASQETAVRDAARTAAGDVRVHCDPDAMAELLFEADLAVSTASTTTYELLALGTPIVSLPVADNQEPIAEALRRRDVALVLDRGAETDQCRRAVERYLTDSDLRREYRERGRSLVDGRGVERTADVIRSAADA